MLLAAGASPRRVNLRGQTPLHQAALANHVKVCISTGSMGERNMDEEESEKSECGHMVLKKSLA
jgi:ankyrin repeat protein